MKYTLTIIMLCFCTIAFAQKKKNVKSSKKVSEKETVIIYTEAEASSTQEPIVLARFLKQNPTHPKYNDYKRKLAELIIAGNTSKSDNQNTDVAKNSAPNGARIEEAREKARLLAANNKKTSAPSLPDSKSSEKNSSASSEKAKKTADMLTRLFNGSDNQSDALINIRNKSKCNLSVQISGKKNYNLEVSANSRNYILVDKGDYLLSTKVCDAKYSSAKKIDKDIEIVLSLD